MAPTTAGAGTATLTTGFTICGFVGRGFVGTLTMAFLGLCVTFGFALATGFVTAFVTVVGGGVTARVVVMTCVVGGGVETAGLGVVVVGLVVVVGTGAGSGEGVADAASAVPMLVGMSAALSTATPHGGSRIPLDSPILPPTKDPSVPAPGSHGTSLAEFV